MTKVTVGGGSSVHLRGTIKPGLEDVIEGTNVTIDKTDPKNPIISSTGGGGSMVYPGSGIPLSTGSAWGTSITDNSSNWNTAYGWGDHASAGYGTVTSVTSANADITVATTTTTPVLTMVQAPALRSATTTVNVSSATAPTSGQVLTATSGTAATWQTPSASGAWLLASGGTLTGANTITGTTTNILKANFDDITTSQVNGAGLWLANNTPASAGAQRLSPSLVLEGQGWKTTATAASQSVRWAIDALPIQGASAPTTNLQFSSSVNSGVYGVVMTLTAGGNLTTYSIKVANVYGAVASSLILQPGSSDKSISAQVFNPNGVGGFIVGGGFDQTRTSGDQGSLSVTQNFVPTSGTATYYGVTVQNTINQTGGANGQITLFNNRPTLTSAVNVTGFDYNPTVTSVSGNHLAYRSTSGNWAMQGSGTNLTLGGGATASQLRFLEPSGSGTNYTSFKAVAQSAYINYSLPPTVGAAGTVLTDVAGNGVLTWEDQTIQTVKVTLSSAEVLALNSSPKVLIAAPGAGKVIQIINAYLYLDYNSTTYLVATDLDISCNGYVLGTSSGFLTNTSDGFGSITPNSSNTNTDQVNKSLDLTTSVDPTTGNSPVYVYVTYRIITL